MMRLTTVLLAAYVVIPTATAAIAQEPTLIQCDGKAVSPLPDPGERFGEVSLFATFNYDRTFQVVLVDGDTGRQEIPFDWGVDVRTGSLTVEKRGAKDTLKMLWQKASMSADFIGFAITRGYTSVLQVDTFAYGNAQKARRCDSTFLMDCMQFYTKERARLTELVSQVAQQG